MFNKDFFALSGNNTSSPRRSPRKEAKETASVGILDVRSVLDGVYGTTQSLIPSDTPDSDGLPMQQKLLICSLLLMLKKGKNKDITVGKVTIALANNINNIDIFSNFKKRAKEILGKTFLMSHYLHLILFVCFSYMKCMDKCARKEI